MLRKLTLIVRITIRIKIWENLTQITAATTSGNGDEWLEALLYS